MKTLTLLLALFCAAPAFTSPCKKPCYPCSIAKDKCGCEKGGKCVCCKCAESCKCSDPKPGACRCGPGCECGCDESGVCDCKDALAGVWWMWEADSIAGTVHVTAAGKSYFVAWAYFPKRTPEGVVLKAAATGIGAKHGSAFAVAWMSDKGPRASAYEVHGDKIEGDGETWTRAKVPASVSLHRPLVALCAAVRRDLPACDAPPDTEQSALRIDALALITVPTISGGIPAKIPDELQAEIERACFELGLWPTQERWRPESWASPSMTEGSIRWARQTYANLYAGSEIFPDLSECARLPRREHALENAGAFVSAVAWGFQNCPWSEARGNMLESLRDAQYFWDLIASCNDTGRNEMLRRRDLYELQRWVGPRVWATGDWTAFLAR